MLNDGTGGITTTGASASSYNVHFNSSTDTLTLKDAKFTQNKTWEGDGATSGKPNRSAAIYSTGALTVALEGTNYLEGQTISGESAGIYAHRGPLTLGGSGSLYTTGKKFGIHCGGVFTISGGVIDAMGATTGIFCNSENVYINGGTLTAAGYKALNAGGSNPLKYIYSTTTYASTTEDGMTFVKFESTGATLSTYKYVRVGPTATVDAPTISPAGGAFDAAQTVTLANTPPLPASTIHWTASIAPP